MAKECKDCGMPIRDIEEYCEECIEEHLSEEMRVFRKKLEQAMKEQWK